MMKKLFLLLMLTILAAPISLLAGQNADSSASSVQPALELIKKGQIKEATADLEKILRQNPGDIEAQSLLANIYLSQDEPSKAEKHYLEVIRMDPTNAQAFNNFYQKL